MRFATAKAKRPDCPAKCRLHRLRLAMRLLQDKSHARAQLHPRLACNGEAALTGWRQASKFAKANQTARNLVPQHQTHAQKTLT